MKVKDLIKELQAADQEAELVFSMPDGCCSDREWLELHSVDFDEHLQYNNKSELVRGKTFPNGTFEFYFEATWLLSSCRRAGAAKRAVQEIVDSQKKWQDEQNEKANKK